MKKVALLILCLLLSACMIAPGMRMNKQPEFSNQKFIDPNFIPISPDLVTKKQSVAYVVGAQDVLNIVIWQHPELAYPQQQTLTQAGANTENNPTISPSGFLVGADGNLFFPLIGKVFVSGMTTDQIRDCLIKRLSKYVRNPQIDVRVTGFRSQKIYVMGEVLKPGLQPITDIPMSITDAINLAGGLDPMASDASQIYVIRGSVVKPSVFWLNARSPDALLLAENFKLQSHDIVYVSATSVARWNRAISLILPTIQTTWFTKSLAEQ